MHPKKRRNLLLLIGLVLIAVTLTIKYLLDGYIHRRGDGLTIYVVVQLIVVISIFSLDYIMVRCSNCKLPLGRDIGKYCPSCGSKIS
jgi:hypothetical protein